MTPSHEALNSVLAAGSSNTPSASPLMWVLFLGFLGAVLAFDLFVLGRRPTPPSFRSTAVQVVFFLSLAIGVGMCLLIFSDYGQDGAIKFISGYLTEDSMSVDNLAVIAGVMTFFGIPREYHHKVLFWGILGAICLRGLAMAGMSLLYLIAFLPALLGAYLIYTAIKSARADNEDEDVTKSLAYRIFNRILPTTARLHGESFFVRVNGKLHATPLMMVVCIVELSDLIFAIDSVPPVYQISGGDIFIAFSSNIMAVLGLRSVFFFFSYLQKRLSWVNEGVCVILGFVGVSMIISNEAVMGWVHAVIPVVRVVPIPVWLDLAVIGGILAVSVVVSLVHPKPGELPIEEAVTSHENMVEVYVDSGYTMSGEWTTGMVRDYLSQAVLAAGRYDTDQVIPVFGFGDRVEPLGDYRVGEPIDVTRPALGQGSNLAAVLEHAAARARTTTGHLIYVILSDFRVDDEAAVRRVFVTIPDNAFIVLVRISDEPGGAEFAASLAMDYNVMTKRVEAIQATDDAGNAHEVITDTIGTRLDSWVALAA